MERRFATFLAVAFLVLIGQTLLLRYFNPTPEKPAAEVAQGEAPGEQKPGEDKPADAGGEAKKPAAAEDRPAEGEAPAEGKTPEEPAAIAEARVTIGSADPASPFRMLVTLVNRGAAIERIELSSAHYQDQEDKSGYLAHLDATDDPQGRGALVGVVGLGTPAAVAGLLAGDVIRQIDATPIATAAALETFMTGTKPGQSIKLTVLRGEESKELTATLGARPLEVVRPEKLDELLATWERQSPDVVRPAHPHPSLRLTLAALDEQRLSEGTPELPGVHLADAAWELLPGASQTEVAFRQVVAPAGIEVIKRYQLAQVPDEAADADGYHLTMSVEMRNTGEAPHQVAYRLEGPNGLPTEGWWYASKISRNWSGVGPRDVVVGWQNTSKPGQIDAAIIGSAAIVGGSSETWRGTPLGFIGVDAQYFAAVLKPLTGALVDDWFAESAPVVVGEIPEEKDKKRLANVSFQLTSKSHELPAGGAPLVQQYQLFAGPKKPAILAEYGLSELVYYGWFGWVSRPMLAVLQIFHDFLFGNYGLAIIMLTVLVRSAMMPMSRKQALNAQKMQELQPELRKLQEKYKNDMEGRGKAQRELFRKHEYNPMSGCLPMFVQLPIFIGLYRSLSVNVELRQAPLLWEGFPWASNLAAPDMLFRWDQYLPGFFIGWLGPYFNLLPVITIALFLWQQKKFMPPPTDEQAAMQQKMMQYMMIFVCVLFFKVPSGLCVYFIASSLWGIAERQFLPKPKLAPVTSTDRVAKLPPTTMTGNGSGGGKRKEKGRK